MMKGINYLKSGKMLPKPLLVAMRTFLELVRKLEKCLISLITTKKFSMKRSVPLKIKKN